MEEAVLDTNLSSANESQIPQPECYSWQLAQVVYMKDRPRSKARGVLQGMLFFFFLFFFQRPLQWLNTVFSFCVILTHQGFLLLIWSY